MKIKKNLKSLGVLFILLIIIFTPSLAFANNNDEKIINQIKSSGTIDVLNVDNLLRARRQTYTFAGTWENKLVNITRTNTQTPITITAQNYNNYSVDVCIFNTSGFSQNDVVGNTKTIRPGQVDALVWSSNELKSVTNVRIFFTMYSSRNNPLTVAITY